MRTVARHPGLPVPALALEFSESLTPSRSERLDWPASCFEDRRLVVPLADAPPELLVGVDRVLADLERMAPESLFRRVRRRDHALVVGPLARDQVQRAWTTLEHLVTLAEHEAGVAQERVATPLKNV